MWKSKDHIRIVFSTLRHTFSMLWPAGFTHPFETLTSGTSYVQISLQTLGGLSEEIQDFPKRSKHVAHNSLFACMYNCQVEAARCKAEIRACAPLVCLLIFPAPSYPCPMIFARSSPHCSICERITFAKVSLVVSWVETNARKSSRAIKLLPSVVQTNGYLFCATDICEFICQYNKNLSILYWSNDSDANWISTQPNQFILNAVASIFHILWTCAQMWYQIMVTFSSIC